MPARAEEDCATSIPTSTQQPRESDVYACSQLLLRVRIAIASYCIITSTLRVELQLSVPVHTLVCVFSSTHRSLTNQIICIWSIFRYYTPRQKTRRKQRFNSKVRLLAYTPDGKGKIHRYKKVLGQGGNEASGLVVALLCHRVHLQNSGSLPACVRNLVYVSYSCIQGSTQGDKPKPFYTVSP